MRALRGQILKLGRKRCEARGGGGRGGRGGEGGRKRVQERAGGGVGGGGGVGAGRGRERLQGHGRPRELPQQRAREALAGVARVAACRRLRAEPPRTSTFDIKWSSRAV